jgi:hypothetical protein
MRKTLLFIALATVSGYSNAQVAYSASGLADFSNMTSVDADGDTQNWGVFDFMTANNGAPVGTSFDAQGELLGSFSWDPATQAPLTPDNWIITPAIDLTSLTAATLSWGRASVDPDYEAENYSVYVVTAVDQTALLTALVAATPVYTETIAVGDEWLERSVNINSFAGQNNVYVAFRHHACTDEFILVIDDILVANTAGLEENKMDVSIFPNPAADVLNVNTSLEVTSVKVFGLDGKIVLSENVDGFNVQINIAELTSGAYIVEAIGANGGVVRTNFIKK